MPLHAAVCTCVVQPRLAGRVAQQYVSSEVVPSYFWAGVVV